MRHTDAHDAISSFLFECGIPFNVTQHPAGMRCEISWCSAWGGA